MASTEAQADEPGVANEALLVERSRLGRTNAIWQWLKFGLTGLLLFLGGIFGILVSRSVIGLWLLLPLALLICIAAAWWLGGTLPIWSIISTVVTTVLLFILIVSGMPMWAFAFLFGNATLGMLPPWSDWQPGLAYAMTLVVAFTFYFLAGGFCYWTARAVFWDQKRSVVYGVIAAILVAVAGGLSVITNLGF